MYISFLTLFAAAMIISVHIHIRCILHTLRIWMFLFVQNFLVERRMSLSNSTFMLAQMKFFSLSLSLYCCCYVDIRSLSPHTQKKYSIVRSFWVLREVVTVYGTNRDRRILWILRRDPVWFSKSKRERERESRDSHQNFIIIHKES